MVVVLVLLVAILIMLLIGVVVAVQRLRTAVAGLRSGVEAEMERLEPLLTELNESGQVTNLELEQLQANVEALSAGRRAREHRRPNDAGGYTA